MSTELFASTFDGLYKFDVVQDSWTEVYELDNISFPLGPEIEAFGTRLYASNSNLQLVVLDQSSGEIEESIDLTFPFRVAFDVVTAMEFVSDTLYAGIAQNGTSSPGTFAIVDTNSGSIGIVGVEHSFPHPCTGLAYDGTAMYAVTGTISDFAKLYIVDLATGATSEVGTIVDLNTAPSGLYLSGLEFADDGTLFTVPTLSSQFEWPYLYSIDPSTANATVSTSLGNLSVLAITNPNGDVRLPNVNGPLTCALQVMAPVPSTLPTFIS